MALAVSIGWSLIVPYFLSLGFSEMDVLMYFITSFAVPLIVLPVVRNWRIKNYLTFGLSMRALCFLGAMYIVSPIQLVLIGAMFSFIITDYWVIYNTLVEDKTVRGNRAFINSIAMSILPIINVFGPALAGVVADSYGFRWLLLTGFLIMLIPIILSRKMGEKRILLDLARAEHNNWHIQEMMFFEGFANAAGWAIPMFVTLRFVSSNFEFGSFFSYLALIGIASALLLGKHSDRSGKRKEYLFPIMVLNGIGLIIAGTAGSFALWALGLSMYAFLIRIEWPFTWAMVTDSAKGVSDAMLAREFWLNSGRMSLLVLTGIWMAFFGDIQAGLVLGGIGYLLFVVFMWARGIGS